MEVHKNMGIWKERNRLKALEETIALILENYTIEEVLEMNELTDEDVLELLYMAGHIKEPAAYLP